MPVFSLRCGLCRRGGGAACLPCLQAFEKNPKDGDTLANLVAVSLHLGKSAARYMSQLKLVAPSHAIVQRTEEGEAAFDRAASAITA